MENVIPYLLPSYVVSFNFKASIEWNREIGFYKLFLSG